jgi:hypothetical protein
VLGKLDPWHQLSDRTGDFLEEFGLKGCCQGGAGADGRRIAQEASPQLHRRRQRVWFSALAETLRLVVSCVSEMPAHFIQLEVIDTRHPFVKLPYQPSYK